MPVALPRGSIGPPSQMLSFICMHIKGSICVRVYINIYQRVEVNTELALNLCRAQHYLNLTDFRL